MLLTILSLFMFPQDSAKLPNVRVFTYEAVPDSIEFYYEYKDQYDRPWHYGAVDIVPIIDTTVKFATEGASGIDYYPWSSWGLYVEKGKVRFKLTKDRLGKEQCIFAITKQGKAKIVPVSQCNIAEYRYAVQIAPLLVMNGKINPKLSTSFSTYFRSGYGILPNGNVLFLIAKQEVTYRQFAQLFLDRGCISAACIDINNPSCYWTPTHVVEYNTGVIVGVH